MFRKKKRMIGLLRQRFGSNPLEEAEISQCRERLPQIGIYHRAVKKDMQEQSLDLDDVTWADLEMDEIFLRINHTQSYLGEQVLYHTLRSGREEFFEQNRDFLNALSEDEEGRLELEYRLRLIGKRQDNYYLPEFFGAADLLRPRGGWAIRLLQVVLAAALLSAVVFRTTPVFLLLAVSAGVNFIVYQLMKLKYDILLSSLSGTGRMLELCDWCVRQKRFALPADTGFQKAWERVRPLRKKIGRFLSVRQSGAAGDAMGLLYEYCLGIALIDVARLSGILTFLSENREAVGEVYRYIGMLDAAVGLYHPLIKDPVCNDFSLHDRAIITGANASGKSTFMKALAVSAILAQTIDTGCCSSLCLPPVKIMTSMAIRDDVVSGESYYVREIRYLKRMLDVIEDGTLTLCIIDEILKGTNQKERLAASEAVLRYIADFPAFCVIATHDMDLVTRLRELYERCYFESRIEDGAVSFDYQIRKGSGGDSNALALLAAFDFPAEVLRDASSILGRIETGNGSGFRQF